MSRRGKQIAAILIALYIVIFSAFSIARYELYNAKGWDLGIYAQLTWNASAGRFLQNTIAETNNMLAIHASYITILLAPLFWLWSDPRTLLIAQSVILGLGAWPIARLAARKFSAWWVPPVFVLLWILYPALGWINRWDFHEIAPVATFFAFALEAADRRAWRQVDVWLLLAILCKEEIGLNVAFFALYAGWKYGRNRWVCVGWFVFGVAWFVVHAFVIFPTLRQADNGLPIHATRYFWLLEGDTATRLAYLVGPDTLHKIAFLIKLFAPLAFISLLAPSALIVALPTFALSFLSSYIHQFDIFMHYQAPIIPAVMVSAVYGAARLKAYLDTHFPRLGLRAIMGAMVGAVSVAWLIYNPFYYRPIWTHLYGIEPGAHVEALREVKQIIPADACVVATNNIQVHYSIRPETYVIGIRGDMDGCTYMIVDLDDRRHNDFTRDPEVACTQFWAKKRNPIYYKDTVVVLKQMPVDADPEAYLQLTAYCGKYIDEMTGKK